MKRHLLRLATAASFLLTVGVAPSAADTITFDNAAAHTGGTFSFGGNVTVSNGVIDEVARVAPVGAFAITGNCGGSFGCIDVATGAFMGPVTTTGANDYAYSGGGTIIVHGGIAALSLPNNTVLFTASFDSASNVILQFDDICQSNPSQCTGSLTGTLAAGTNAINPVLAAALGVSPNILGGNSQTLFFSFAGVSLPGDSIAPSGTASANTTQLEVVTPPAAAAVPEPGSLVLLGSGFMLFAHVVRRRLK
jgi:hypothetical protein